MSLKYATSITPFASLPLWECDWPEATWPYNQPICIGASLADMCVDTYDWMLFYLFKKKKPKKCLPHTYLFKCSLLCVLWRPCTTRALQHFLHFRCQLLICGIMWILVHALIVVIYSTNIFNMSNFPCGTFWWIIGQWLVSCSHDVLG